MRLYEGRDTQTPKICGSPRLHTLELVTVCAGWVISKPFEIDTGFELHYNTSRIAEKGLVVRFNKKTVVWFR